MYEYQKERPYVFTDEGSRKFLEVFKAAERCFTIAGAVTAGRLLEAAGSGDSWQNMAVVDRLLEIGAAEEIPRSCAWQHRVFVRAFSK